MIKRSEHNPILKPDQDNYWEAQAVFNGCPVADKGKIHFFYRALSLPHYHTSSQSKTIISDIGLAQSRDGIHFQNRRRFIVPEESWEKFGCEDPRVTKLNNRFYIFYTALSDFPFNSDTIKVALAITKDFKKIEKHLVTPFNAKAMALFPEKINGKMWAILTADTDKPPAKIALASFDKETDIWAPSYWNNWYKNIAKSTLPLQRNSQDHIEVGAPPVKTKDGWLIIYSYIRNYFSGQRLFGIEAVLLDLKNPLKIIGRTEAPLLTPEEYYEKIGVVPNVVFPSGALIKKDELQIYYGAADTVCALASIKLSILLNRLSKKESSRIKLNRWKNNPILISRKEYAWQAKAIFNSAALRLGGKIHLIYRAMGNDNTSVFGYAASLDGLKFDYFSAEPIYQPREFFEMKNIPNGNSGCEDPRLTRIGNKIFMVYAAYDGKHPPRVALTWITVKNFLAQNWLWAKPVLISAPDLDNKDAFVFPVKIGGKYLIVHRHGDSIDYSFSRNLDFKNNNWLEENVWISPRKGWWDSRKVGAAAPPVRTAKGWVMLYHGVSDDGVYRVGAVLLDLKNPLKVIGRTYYPILEPEAPYEKTGQVANVVFPCGAVLIGKKLLVYYGGADQVLAGASIDIDDLVKILKS